jgi:hypothetical protein
MTLTDSDYAALLRKSYIEHYGASTVDQPPATERQKSFLSDLVTTRSAPPELVKEASDELDSGLLSKKRASKLISSLLLYPKSSRKRKPFDDVALDSPAHRELREMLREIPVAKYAIPSEELMLDLLKGSYAGDLIFVEVRKLPNEPLRLKKLLGSPGDFSRMDIPVEDALTFARVVKRDPYEYTKRFAVHHTCCGRCGAALTDELSRKLYLGPRCRQVFRFPVG